MGDRWHYHLVGQVDGENGQTQDMYRGGGTSETCDESDLRNEDMDIGMFLRLLA